MERLIEAEALMKRINCYPQIRDTVAKELRYVPTVDAVPLEDYKSMERTVNKLTKAIADAEPVVRCEDCTMWNKERQMCDRFSSTWTAEHTKPNDYCCWGERKEDTDGSLN